jgi:hypothetical protein
MAAALARVALANEHHLAVGNGARLVQQKLPEAMLRAVLLLITGPLRGTISDVKNVGRRMSA